MDGWTADEAGRPVLKARVSAAAAEGAANAAVIALLSRLLKVPKSAIRIATGDTARLKRLEIEGLEAADIDAALGKPG